ncbi:MAG: cupin domain-containing protein [Saprospiraceae bacterium]|nr:cupin domain-containing protein [Saprospiraceae bacterium]
MQYQYPHTIENGGGDTIIFKRLVKDPAGDWLDIEAIVEPGAGPPMHVHHRQDERLTVVQGKMGSQVLGEEPKYFNVGDSITYKAGEAHKFWCVGNERLVCKGAINPAHNFEYFLTGIYDSMKANGGKQPGAFEGAWLLNRYRSEFDMLNIPGFVKKVIFPVALFFGKLQGKHRKFEGAPPPLA